MTARLHPALAAASCQAARALAIPVVGLDLMVPDVEGPDYVLIEANSERARTQSRPFTLNSAPEVP